MTVISILSDLVEEPRRFLEGGDAPGTGKAGLAGFLFGALGLFAFLRLLSAVPPGLYSFLNVLIAVLGINFALAAAMHLFLGMTGCAGSAPRLFSMLGVTELLWCALIPLGFLARLELLSPVAAFVLCLAGLLSARTLLVRRLYSVSLNKAALAVGLPYAAVLAGAFTLLLYALVCLVWLFA